MDKTQLSSNDFDYTSKTITTEVTDKYGKTLISTIQRRKHYSGKYCRKLLKIIFKNIGLTLLLIDCYQREKGYIRKLNSTTLRVIGTLKSFNDNEVTRQTIEDIIRNILNEYATDIYALDFKPLTNCTAILNTPDGSKWIITTIGYGHIAPVTFWGRITCIIYAIIGIPLMLIYLALIGNMLARMFRVIFLNLLCCRCFYDTIKRKREERRKRLEEWEQRLREHEEEEAKRRGLPLPPKKIQTFDEDSDLEADEDDDEIIDGSKLHVPLTISVIVLSMYTLIGAVIFPTWEDWSTASAAYFSFITISTIGFGDLVPGNGRLTEPHTATELLIGGIYLLFGLALLSMCLNLMKDEIIAKSQREVIKDEKDKQNNENIDKIKMDTVNSQTNEFVSTMETSKLMMKNKTKINSENFQNEYDNEGYQKDR
ncbi:unnamed protein product [Heterobilharzia americana]|nr:unnamed protein product [Heterobilharzia americana]